MKTIASLVLSLPLSLMAGVLTVTAAVDTTAPRLIATSPVNAKACTTLRPRVAVSFNEAMDPASITPETMTLTGPNGVRVKGRVTYSGITAVFTPESDLLLNTKYIAAVSTGAKDLAENSFSTAVGWYFSTGPTCGSATSAPSTFDVKFNYINIAGGAACTSDNTAVAVTFTTLVNSTTLTPENVYLLDQAGLPILSKYTYLQLDALKSGLTTGNQGEDVKKLQVFLRTLGYFSRTGPTGNVGPGTKAALIAWQRSVGIKATGVFDSASSNHAHVLILSPNTPIEGDSVYTLVASNGIQDVLGKSLSRNNRRSVKTAPDCAPGLVGLRGPIGVQGIQGIQGILGPLGETGATGLTGPQGATGTQGITGEVGTQGERGQGGPGGAAGSSASGLEEAVPHATFKDTTSQPLTDSAVAQVVTLNTDTEKYLINHSTTVDASRIYPTVNGRYRITASSQVYGDGVFSVWLRKNGVDVSNTSRIWTLQNGYGVITTINVVDSLAGDYFELMQSSSVVGTGLKSFTGLVNPTAPDSPSIIVHMVRTGSSVD